jgi:hypothetical protein
VEKQRHHRTVKDLEKHEEPPEAEAGATVKEQMARRLKTAEGRNIYKKRTETVEPVFGIMSLRTASTQNLCAKFATRYLKRCLVYEVRSVRNFFNCGDLHSKSVYYHFLLVLPTLTALKGGVLDPIANTAGDGISAISVEGIREGKRGMGFGVSWVQYEAVIPAFASRGGGGNLP